MKASFPNVDQQAPAQQAQVLRAFQLAPRPQTVQALQKGVADWEQSCDETFSGVSVFASLIAFANHASRIGQVITALLNEAS